MHNKPRLPPHPNAHNTCPPIRVGMRGALTRRGADGVGGDGPCSFDAFDAFAAFAASCSSGRNLLIDGRRVRADKVSQATNTVQSLHLPTTPREMMNAPGLSNASRFQLRRAAERRR